MIRILIVDDNQNTRKLMQVVLKKNGYETLQAKDGYDALCVLETEKVDLIVLDIMMPNLNGYDFLKTIRDEGSLTPVLMVSAKDAPSDRVKGFLLGTDDYLVKPFNEQELVLRIQALLRRARIGIEKSLVVGKTILKEDAFEVIENDESIMLPKKEFQLLFKMLSSPNKTFTRQQLMDEFWDLDCDTMQHTVDVHISRLRDRFKNNKDFEIVTVRGLGYKAVFKNV